MAGEAQGPDTPDSIPDEVYALARRIERVMIAEVSVEWGCLAGETRQTADDRRAIYIEMDRRRSKQGYFRALHSARIHWLAGVLAGAMGERRTEKEPTDGKA